MPMTTPISDELAPLGFAVMPSPPTPGVTRSVFPDQPPDGWLTEARHLRFVADSPVRIEPRYLVLHGALVNPTDRTLSTFSPPESSQSVELSGAITLRSHPTSAGDSPIRIEAPIKLTLGPHARLSLVTAIVLSRYDYRPGSEAVIRWTYTNTDGREKTTQTFTVVLP